MKIHPILLLRIYKVCEYYLSLAKQIPLRGRANRLNMKKQESDLAALLAKLKKEEDDKSSSGGGGTLKGLRGDEVQRAAAKDSALQQAISTKMRAPTKPF